MGIRIALSTAISAALLVSAPTSGAETVGATNDLAVNELGAVSPTELTIKPRLERNVVKVKSYKTYEPVERLVASLPKGVTKVARTGSREVIITAYETSEIGTNFLTKKLVDRYVLKAGGPQVIFIGTYVAPPPKPQPKPQATPQPKPTATRQETAASRDVSSTWPRVRGAEDLNWAALAKCESSGNPLAVNKSGPYYGLYQFLASTWRSVGGEGLPIEASAAEQTYRAKLLWKRSGAGQWPVCGKLL